MPDLLAHVRYRAPYDWGSVLAFLEARTIAGVEAVLDGAYSRTVRFEEHLGSIEVTHAARRRCLVLSVRPSCARALPELLTRVERVLDPEADVAVIGAHLARDPMLAPSIERRPGLRVPGGWDGFELAVRAILGQQITVKAARLLAGRLTASFGDPLTREHASRDGLTHAFPRPERLAAADLTSIGLPRARAAALRALASEAAADQGLFQRRSSLADSVARFRALPGIGEWTAQYIALRALRDPDAFPASDIGLLRGASAALGERITPAALLARAERWRPFRAYAAQHLWMLDADRARERSATTPAR